MFWFTRRYSAIAFLRSRVRLILVVGVRSLSCSCCGLLTLLLLSSDGIIGSVSCVTPFSSPAAESVSGTAACSSCGAVVVPDSVEVIGRVLDVGYDKLVGGVSVLVADL